MSIHILILSKDLHAKEQRLDAQILSHRLDFCISAAALVYMGTSQHFFEYIGSLAYIVDTISPGSLHLALSTTMRGAKCLYTHTIRAISQFEGLMTTLHSLQSSSSISLIPFDTYAFQYSYGVLWFEQLHTGVLLHLFSASEAINAASLPFRHWSSYFELPLHFHALPQREFFVIACRAALKACRQFMRRVTTRWRTFLSYHVEAFSQFNCLGRAYSSYDFPARQIVNAIILVALFLRFILVDLPGILKHAVAANYEREHGFLVLI